jgi:hypothetical protein
MKLVGSARELYDRVRSEYDLDDVALALLTCACESLQRAQEAAALTDKHGMVYHTRLGEPRQSPSCKIEFENRQACAASLQKLGLNLGD